VVENKTQIKEMEKNLFEFENFDLYQRVIDFADNIYDLTENILILNDSDYQIN